MLVLGSGLSAIGLLGVLVVTLDKYWRVTAPTPGYEMQLGCSLLFAKVI